MEYIKEKENLFRYTILIVQVVTETLRRKLMHCFPSLNFENILNIFKHKLYHLWYKNKCCSCTSADESKGQGKTGVIRDEQWGSMFDKCSSKCAYPCSCRYIVKSNLDVNVLDITLASCLLLNIAGLDDNDTALVEKLRGIRNERFGHIRVIGMTDGELKKNWEETVQHVINLASTFGFKDKVEIEIEKIKTQVFDATFIETNLKIIEHIVPGIYAQFEDLKSYFDKKLANINTYPLESEDATYGVVNRLLTATVKTVTDDMKFDQTKRRLENNRGKYIRLERLESYIIKLLKKEKVLVLTGKCGTGKTWTGEEMLRIISENLGAQQSQYTPIIINRADQWEYASEDDGKFIVLIDDPLGKSHCDFNRLTDWEYQFENIESETQGGKFVIIITLRDNILNECIARLKKYPIFGESKMLNTSSSQLVLKEDEKVYYLKECCKKNHVQIESDPSNVNIPCDSEVSHSFVFKITMEEIYQIAKCDPLIGFQQSCFQFFTKQSLFLKGVDYFMHASKDLLNDIDKLRGPKTRTQYCVLVYMLLHGRSINVCSIDEDLLKSLSELFRIPEIDIKYCTKHEIADSYLTMISKEEFDFQHESIKEGVLMSFAVYNPLKFLEYGSKNTITGFARSSRYKPQPGEICVCLPEYADEKLAERLSLSHDISEIAELKTTDDHLFLPKLLDVVERCDSIETKSNKNDIGRLLKEYVNDLDISDIKEREMKMYLALFQAVNYDKSHLVVLLLKRYIRPSIAKAAKPESRDIVAEEAENSVKIVCYLHAYDYLLQKKQDTLVQDLIQEVGFSIEEMISQLSKLPSLKEKETKHVFFLVYKKWRNILLHLLDASVDVKECDSNGLSLMHYSCQYNWIDVMEMLVTVDEGILHLRNSNGSNPVVYAAEDGKKSVVEYLLKLNVDIKTPNRNGNFLIHICCQNGWNDVVQNIISKDQAVLNQINFHKETPLVNAAVSKEKKRVQFLLQWKSDLTIQDLTGNSLIHYCSKLGWTDLITEILQQDKEVLNQQNANKSTPIVLAAQNEQMDTVKYLLDQNADVSISDGSNYLIHYCCMFGWNNVIEIMVKRSMEVLSQTNTTNATPIVLAAEYRHKILVEYLLQFNVGMDIPDCLGDYLIHYCAKWNWNDVVEAIIKQHKVELNRTNEKGNTPICQAAVFKSKATVQCLLENDADISIKNDDGEYLIHLCCNEDWSDLVKALMQKDLEFLNMQNAHRRTPLSVAAINGNHETVQCLLDFKADTTIPDDDGNYFIHHCCDDSMLTFVNKAVSLSGDILNKKNSYSMTPVVYGASLNQKDVVLHLLDMEADISIPDKDGQFLIHYCCEKNWIDVIPQLVDRHKEMVNQTNSCNSTPIVHAAERGNEDVIRFLLDLNADLDLPDKRGNCLLHYCCQWNLNDLIDIIVRKSKVTLDHQNMDKFTPLQFALDHKNEDCALKLLKYGADPTIPNADGMDFFQVLLEQMKIQSDTVK